jgi:hypothetical protein
VRPDSFIDLAERRAAVMRKLPWPIPAVVLIEFSDANLDALADADGEHYWSILNDVVSRITGDDG